MLRTQNSSIQHYSMNAKEGGARPVRSYTTHPLTSVGDTQCYKWSFTIRLISPFTPARESAFHLPRLYPPTATGVFKLFFTAELVDIICRFTNAYASLHYTSKPSYVEATGGEFREVSVSEFYRFFDLLILYGDCSSACHTRLLDHLTTLPRSLGSSLHGKGSVSSHPFLLARR